eukprot:3250131-Rhodomonas_salina.3
MRDSWTPAAYRQVQTGLLGSMHRVTTSGVVVGTGEDDEVGAGVVVLLEEVVGGIVEDDEVVGASVVVEVVGGLEVVDEEVESVALESHGTSLMTSAT